MSYTESCVEARRMTPSMAAAMLQPEGQCQGVGLVLEVCDLYSLLVPCFLLRGHAAARRQRQGVGLVLEVFDLYSLLVPCFLLPEATNLTSKEKAI